MSDRDWDAELKKIDRQMERVSDEALFPSRQAATPQAKAQVAEVQKATSTFGVFARLSLAVALGVGMAFWPYSARCGFGLAGYLVLVQNSGNTTTGNSGVAIDDNTNTTASFPVRIIDVVPETANTSGSFTEVIVKWNAPRPTITIDFTGETASVSTAGGHQYLNPVGV